MTRLLLLAPVVLAGAVSAKQWCARGDACWPTADDLKTLEAALAPAAPRILNWSGPGTPRVCAVPAGSPGDQPLYGLGAAASLRPVYTNVTPADASRCMHADAAGEGRDLCIAATRNSPLTPNSPQIVVFALTAEHVQTAVRFAVRHNLCVAVAGTGHDFLNRHSCEVDGILIRTTLLKGAEWDVDDDRGFGVAAGSVRVGAGHTFSELAREAGLHGRIISQGWGITVGVVGWSLGGGHGPFANSAGMGVDNILDAEVVTADGTLIVANATSNADLLWALKGGGGSTWGVITALTLRVHPLPAGGITQRQIAFSGTFCERKVKGGAFNRSVDSILEWQLRLPASFSGGTFITPEAGDVMPGGIWPGRPTCGGFWSITLVYEYLGAKTDTDYTEAMTALNTVVTDMDDDVIVTGDSVHSYATQWDRAVNFALEPITPTGYMRPVAGSYAGSLPSVLVSRDACTAGGAGSSAVGTLLKERAYDCARDATDPLHSCVNIQLYQDMTGNVGALQPDGASISKAFRSAFLHIIAVPPGWVGARLDEFYALGPHSYFGESAYEMGRCGWKRRLWGDNYAKLLDTKRKWDPAGVFWCRHCVGDGE